MTKQRHTSKQLLDARTKSFRSRVTQKIGEARPEHPGSRYWNRKLGVEVLGRGILLRVDVNL